MKRPRLQKMLQAVRTREVNLIMLTGLSRLSRSTKDFCEMWEFFEKHGCEFHSLREHIDTSTAAGELMLKSFANFVEFERRQPPSGYRLAFGFERSGDRITAARFRSVINSQKFETYGDFLAFFARLSENGLKPENRQRLVERLI